MLALSSLLWLATWPFAASGSPLANTRKKNDWSCTSAKHPNPVVLLHGMGANDDLNFITMEPWLQKQGFCTFSLTYGVTPPYPPFVGGLQPISESSKEVAAFIRQVQQRTGAAKVDLVGHSEGAMQSLYVPKVQGVSSIVDNIVAIAPPTHGATASGFLTLVENIPFLTPDLRSKILDGVNCGMCKDVFAGGPFDKRLNDGQPVKQPGNKITIITSRHDEAVTPTDTAFVYEDGVNNIYVQDYCPLDIVGHLGEAVDLNVFNLILNSLENQVGRKFTCSLVQVPVRRHL
ncbi:hypothetical protein NLG97_g1316 [Lecanicillium saksenae]|uniref:Uncharacterized protein n=1 Tax=Lecanicillium saksenae TaxID=468837 RepID=A0ACC1R436_9HYPO|nr:hypothetical protein NLG97_g1316 [Lecanicillium saksenae]